MTFKSCQFLQNKAKEFGGAIYILDSGDISFENCSFENNEALYGGAIYYDNEFESINYFEIKK